MGCVSLLPAGGKDAGGREESLKEERPVISGKGFVQMSISRRLEKFRCIVHRSFKTYVIISM